MTRRTSAPMPRRDVVLGVDVGGTNVRGALAGLDGRILADRTEPTRGHAGDALVAQIVGLRDTLRTDLGPAETVVVRSAGLAVPVTIHPASGVVASEHNVPGLAGLRLGDVLASALGVPVALENDANLAALAEGRHGAATGHRDYVVIAIGTGIGMGIVADGRLVRGSRGGAGEIGFLPIGAGPATPESRRSGAFERAAAGPALRRRIEAAATGPVATVLRPDAGLADVVAAASHDAVAREILAEEAGLLARGIAAVVALLDPGIVLLSGGVGSVDGLAAAVGAALAGFVAEPPRVETARVGARGPLVGAIDLAIDLARSIEDAAPPAS